MREFAPYRSEVAMLEAERDRLKAERDELLEAAARVVDVLYSTDTDLTGGQERAVEALLWAKTKAEGSA